MPGVLNAVSGWPVMNITAAGFFRVLTTYIVLPVTYLLNVLNWALDIFAYFLYN